MSDLIRIEDPEDPGTLRPALRPLEVTAIEEEGETLLLLADPLHLLENAVVLPAAYLPVLQMLDGSRTLEDLCTELVRQTGDLGAGGFARSLVTKLDEHLLLDSPRFRDAWQAHVEEYRKAPARPAALAGISYPETQEELRAFLAELKSAARTLPESEPARDSVPDALVAPHIDLRRGGVAVARAYLEWEGSERRLILPGGDDARPAEIVVAFGTGHSVMGSLAVPTRKDFVTPLGTVPACREVVEGLASRLGEAIFTEEIAHREEHSLEFQALFLADLMERGARYELVPILCGSFQVFLETGQHPRDDQTIAEFVAALREALRASGRPVRFLAGVDFSHVGGRFGDHWQLSEENLAELETQDRAVIQAALTGDADRWFEAVADQRDRTHICGFSSLYLMLRTMGAGPGRLLRYEQSPEEDTDSVVTYASLAFDTASGWRRDEPAPRP